MFFLLLLVLMFFGLVLQAFVGPFPGMGGQILILPMVFFYAAAALPLWGMLSAAFLAGLMWECRVNIPLDIAPLDGEPGMIFGWSILVYAALGAVMNGLHPLFLRGRWQFHCIMAGVLTSILVLVEYVVITFRREPFAFIWPRHVWDQILSSGLVTVFVSPFLFIVLNWIGRRLGHFEKRYTD
jgi:hypothetical protein